MASEQHVFSTGVLRIGAAGNTALTDSANQIGSVQDASLDVQYQDKTLFTAAQSSVFPIDVAYHEGKATMKCSVRDVNRNLFTYMTNMTKTTVSGVDTFTLGATSQPIYFRAEFDGVDTTGRAINMVATKCFTNQLGVAFKLTDFGDVTFDIQMISDPNATTAGTVLTLAMQQ